MSVPPDITLPVISQLFFR